MDKTVLNHTPSNNCPVSALPSSKTYTRLHNENITTVSEALLNAQMKLPQSLSVLGSLTNNKVI